MSRKTSPQSHRPSGSQLRRMREMTQQVASPRVEYHAVPPAARLDAIMPLEALRFTGRPLPGADHLDDRSLGLQLWELIHHLALLRIFLSHTNHLSDRQLYRRLQEDVLHRPLLPERDGTCRLNLCLSHLDQDWWPFLAYYADDLLRAKLKREFPDWTLPGPLEPPFDRDRRLPRPSSAHPSESEIVR